MRSARSRPRRLVAALGAAHERLELGPRLGVGVLGEQLAGGGDGIAHAAHSKAGLGSGMLADARSLALLLPRRARPRSIRPWPTRFARLALACVHQEYPNKIAHVMGSRRRRAPAARADAGLLRLLRLALVGARPLAARAGRAALPEAPFAAEARAALGAQPHRRRTSPPRCATSRAKGRVSFERPYGLAWLLQLARRAARVGRRRRRAAWAAALAPLERASAAQRSATGCRS